MEDKINTLKCEIKKLKNCKYNKPITTYKLIYQENRDNKMYNALLFDNDYDDLLSDKELKPFIYLNSKCKYIINYSITLDVVHDGHFQCSFLLGTKDGKKFKIIKGSKTICNQSHAIGKQIIINNSILYETDTKVEIFMICCFDETKVKFSCDKSILKYTTI